MKRNFAFVLLLLAFASIAAAQELPLVVEPDPPTSADTITLRFPGCRMTTDPVVERTGYTIRITIDSTMCGDPPAPQSLAVQLPPLVEGFYTVEVFSADGFVGTKSFTVEPASRPFEVRPSVIPTTVQPLNGLSLLVPRNDALNDLCGTSVPSTCTFDVGGMRATLIGGAHSVEMFMLVPPKVPAGYADIVVSNGTRSLVLRNAVYYFDPSVAPNLDVFERVLLPVLFNARGVNGSDWRTELQVDNHSDVVIAAFNHREILQWQNDYGIDSRYPSMWREERPYPRGVALLVPRNESHNLSFSLRIRDVSRVAQGFGTSIPVVRESQMFPRTMTLLDVPLDPAYRVKLRIYGFGNEPAGAGRVSGIGEFTMTRSCTELTCASTPWYAELDLPARGKDTRENLFITPPAGIRAGWAFATVTNNETQQVTIVTPDGIGGERCNPCTIP